MHNIQNINFLLIWYTLDIEELKQKVNKTTMWPANWTLNHLSKLRKKQPRLVDDALQKMIASNQDLAWSLVISAYLDEEINLGKAAELLNVHELELRERFISLGIPIRIGPADQDEARAEVEALNAWFINDASNSTT